MTNYSHKLMESMEAALNSTDYYYYDVYPSEESPLDDELAAISKDYLKLLLWHMENNANHTVDFTKPFIKNSLKYVYPLFIFLFACVVLGGVGGNVAILFTILRRRLHDDPSFFLIGNLALSDILKAAVVLPITVAHLLIENWIWGSFMCYFLPMLHSFPIHASMLTFLVVAVDRYRLIVHPMKSRVPAGLCVLGIWVIAVCVVLPYAVYIKYYDLGTIIGEKFKGVAMCLAIQEKHRDEYIRAMFVLLYCLPLASIAFLYIRVSAELKVAELSGGTAMQIEDNIHSTVTSETSYQSRITWSTSELNDGRVDPEGASTESHPENKGTMATLNADDANPDAKRVKRASETHRVRYSEPLHDYHEDDIDYRKEKRSQKYIIAMVMLFAICWCPVNILILITHFVYETDNNMGHFDITYLTFTFFGFLSTCVNPVLVGSWLMSNRTKDRLRGYFRFSNRRRSSAHSSTSRTTEIYAPTHTPSPRLPKQQNGLTVPKSYV